MIGPLLMATSGLFCMSAVLSFVLARRYGWRFAALMPALALLLFIVLLWHEGGFAAHGRLELAFWVLVAAAPTFVGTGAGILLARRGRG